MRHGGGSRARAFRSSRETDRGFNPRKVILWLTILLVAILTSTGWWWGALGLLGRALAATMGAGKATVGDLTVVRMGGRTSAMRFEEAVLLGLDRWRFERALEGIRLLGPGSERSSAGPTIIQPALTGRGGCALAATGVAAKNGAAVVGVNVDLPAPGVAARSAVVYLVMGSGQIPYGGVGYPGLDHLQAGMNQAGLVAAVVVTDRQPDADPARTPIAAILAESRNVGEALGLLLADPPALTADIVLADTTSPPLLVHCFAGTVRPEPDTGGLVLAPGAASAPEPPRSSIGLSRQQRLAELTTLPYGSLDLQTVTSILRDRFDTDARRIDPSGDVIASEMTSLSAVFDPVGLTFWVAGGSPPASFGPYHGFGLDFNRVKAAAGSEDSPGSRGRGPREGRGFVWLGPVAVWPAAPPPPDTYAEGRESFEQSQAGLADLLHGRYGAAATHLERAIQAAEIAPIPKPPATDPTAFGPCGLGRLWLRLGDARRLAGTDDAAAQAIEAYEKGLAAQLSRDDQAYAHAVLGSLYERAGRVRDAAAQYQAALAKGCGLEAVDGPAREGIARLGR